MNPFVHLVAGLLVSRKFSLDGESTAAGSVVSDLDSTFVFLFPFSARGLLHSVAGGLVLAAPVYLLAGRRRAVAVASGFVTHLALDMVAGPGIPVLLPLNGFYGLGLNSSSPVVNLAAVSLMVTAYLGSERVSLGMFLDDPG
jgi:membrane-bound metal-dependent hydrolase YbcI (DUF457 family)